jgi:hypothetical protein
MNINFCNALNLGSWLAVTSRCHCKLGRYYSLCSKLLVVLTFLNKFLLLWYLDISIYLGA